MPNFQYRALNANHELVSGEVEADAVGQAIALIEANGLVVQSIGLASPEPTSPFYSPAEASIAAQTQHAVSPDATVAQQVLAAHMAKVLRQGQAIAPALHAYTAEMPSGRRRRELGTVCRVLEGGDSAGAAAALAALPDYWIPLLSSATASQDPGRVLQGFLQESRRADELRRQWWATLAYPLLVFCLAIAVLLALCLTIVPAFREIFDDFGLELPALTMFVLNVSRWITEGAGLVIIVALVLIIGTFLMFRLTLPTSFGAWLRNGYGAFLGRSTAIAQFSRFAADLLEAGVDTPTAVRIAAYATNRPSFQFAGWELASALQAGDVASSSLDQPPLTATAVYALKSAMPATSRIRLLREISAFRADVARHRLSWAHGFVGPAALTAIGLVVGGVVLALFLPLIDLINNLSG